MTPRLETLTGEHLDEAFALATEVFARQSTLHLAIGTELAAYRAYMRGPFEAMAGEGLSSVAVGPANGKVRACLVVTDICAEHAGDVPPAFAPIAALTRALNAEYRRLRQPRLGEAALVDMAATAKGHEGRGLYQALRRHAAGRLKKLGFRAILGELSSPATAHVVLDRMGHEAVARQGLSDFVFEGRAPFAGIDAPREIILAEGRL